MDSTTIVVASLKGGAGKTTSSYYLAAVAARRGGPVTLIDTDPHGTVSEWFEKRPIADVDLVIADSQRMARREVGERRQGTVIVDTPHADEHIVSAALVGADAVVVPTQTGGPDAQRVQHTLLLVGDRPHGLVICDARPERLIYQDFVASFTAAGVDVWGTVRSRVGIQAGAFTDAGPNPDGLAAYAGLLDNAVTAARKVVAR